MEALKNNKKPAETGGNPKLANKRIALSEYHITWFFPQGHTPVQAMQGGQNANQKLQLLSLKAAREPGNLGKKYN